MKVILPGKLAGLVERLTMPKLVKSLASVMAANLVSAFLGFAILAMLTRQLTPVEFGLLAPLIGVLDISQVFIDAVVAAGAVHVAVLKLKSDPAKADMAFKIAFCIRMGLAVMVAIVALPIAPWLSQTLFGNQDLVRELRLVFVAVPALAISLSAISVLQAQKRFSQLAIVTLFKNSLRFSFLGVLALAQFLSVETAISAICFAAFATAALAVFSAPFGYVRTPGIDRGIASEMFAVNKWMIIMVVVYVGGRIDIFMLSALSDPEQVGWYSAALQLCMIVTLFSQSLMTTLFPTTSGLETATELRRYFNRAMKWSVLVIVPYGAMVLLSGWITPLLLGRPFAEAAPVLNFLMGSAFLTLATNPLILLLFPLGEVRVLALTGVLQLVVRVALNLIVMPLYGASGAGAVELFAKVLTIGAAVLIVELILRRRSRAESKGQTATETEAP